MPVWWNGRHGSFKNCCFEHRGSSPLMGTNKRSKNITGNGLKEGRLLWEQDIRRVRFSLPRPRLGRDNPTPLLNPIKGEVMKKTEKVTLFVQELNELIKRHHVTLEAGQCELEGALLLMLRRKPRPLKLKTINSLGCNFFCLKEN